MSAEQESLVMVARVDWGQSSRLYVELGACCGCGRQGYSRELGTAYNNEESNWAILCDICLEESNRYWSERWEDYRSLVR